MMIMAIIRYVLYWPFNILFVLSAFLLSPFLAALSMLQGRPTLPGFLQWWSTVDDTLDGGQHQHPEIYTVGATGFSLWWQRTCWICRNPAHGWGTRLLGFPTSGMTIVSGTGYDGWTIMRAANGSTYFSYRWDGSRKLWIGWNPKAYDGVYHQYEFQPFT
jgi:hypothetical protein